MFLSLYITNSIENLRRFVQVMYLSLYISWIQNLPKLVENLWKPIASILTQSTSNSYLKIIIMFTISGSVASKRVFSTTWGIAYFWKIGNWCGCCFYQLRGSASILQDERLLNLLISVSTLALLVRRSILNQRDQVGKQASLRSIRCLSFRLFCCLNCNHTIYYSVI